MQFTLLVKLFLIATCFNNGNVNVTTKLAKVTDCTYCIYQTLNPEYNSILLITSFLNSLQIVVNSCAPSHYLMGLKLHGPCTDAS